MPKSLAHRVFFTLLVGGAYISLGITCLGQESIAQSEEKGKRTPRGAIVVAPIPISSPAIGSGLVPVVGYIFPFSTKDKVSSPSVIGAGGIATNNGSRGFIVGGQLNLNEGNYRITSAFLKGNINYDVYGSGRAEGLKLPLEQTGKAFFGEFLRQIGWDFLVGPRFMYGNSLLALKPSTETGVPIPPDLGLHTTLTSLGMGLTRETTKNPFYPTSGTRFTFMADFYSKGLGSKYSFQTYAVTFNKYWSISPNQVLAYDGYLCGTGGQPPFYGNCKFGMSNRLRGYTTGKYFTRYMGSTQLEYRLSLPRRLGLVAFGGLGGVIPGGQQLYGSRHLLPAGGGGLRFQVSKRYRVNLRADIGVGKDGHTTSLGIGEAF